MAWDRTKQPEPMTYNSYCWFTFINRQYTIRCLFPPIGREDTYGGKTETEIRILAFEKLNELEHRYGNVTIEMIGDIV